MGRLPLVDPDDPGADPSAAELLRMMRAATGRDFAVLQAVANHPEALQSLAAFLSVAYANNTLSPGQRELAYLGASVANDCHY
ncbi:MAG TPA: carboxymuconolactone decarboxylase family protein [Acidimicrobiales bacterium]|jgi:alkylhydroperoxidase family enzyme